MLESFEKKKSDVISKFVKQYKGHEIEVTLTKEFDSNGNMIASIAGIFLDCDFVGNSSGEDIDKVIKEIYNKIDKIENAKKKWKDIIDKLEPLGFDIKAYTNGMFADLNKQKGKDKIDISIDTKTSVCYITINTTIHSKRKLKKLVNSLSDIVSEF